MPASGANTTVQRPPEPHHAYSDAEAQGAAAAAGAESGGVRQVKGHDEAAFAILPPSPPAAQPDAPVDEPAKTNGDSSEPTMELAKSSKPARAGFPKPASRQPQLYLDLPDATAAAQATFAVLSECTYANRYIGTTDPALECDCASDWGESPTPHRLAPPTNATPQIPSAM